MANLPRMIDMGSAAQINEIAQLVEADRIQPVTGDAFIAGFLGNRGRALVAQELQQLDFEILPFAAHVFDGAVNRQLLAHHGNALFAHFLHPLFDGGQVFGRQRVGQVDVIVEAGRGCRSHTEPGLGPDFLHGSGHQMGRRVALGINGEVLL